MDQSVLSNPLQFGDFKNRLLERAKEPSALPHTLIEVLRLLKDENKASVQELSEVLMRDPALTTRLLRISNSARYGTRCEITTMKQAVMLLGMKTVSALTLTAGLYDLTGKWQLTLDRVRFWRHSLQVAIAARLIAEFSGHANPDEAFVCGLLHDIGILLMENASPQEFAPLWHRIDARELLTEQEEGQWRNLHAMVGQAFLEHWNFPSIISYSVGEHHNPVLARNTDEVTMTFRIVALANHLSPYPIARSQKVLPNDTRHRQALRVGLHLKPGELKQIVKMVLTQLLSEGEFLEIDIGSHDEYVKESNKIIYDQYLEALEELRKEKRMMNPNIDGISMARILEEARAALERQYKETCELLSRDWRGECLASSGSQELPESTPATQILSKQYMAMDNVLQEAGDKLSSRG
jgi:putative nucleotidyltransferase with HDIG domain